MSDNLLTIWLRSVDDEQETLPWLITLPLQAPVDRTNQIEILPGRCIFSRTEKLSDEGEEHEKIDKGKYGEGKMKKKQGALVVDKASCVPDSWIEAWIRWREYVDQC